MAITNKPKITDRRDTNVVRSLIEQRGEWFYLMNEEAEKLGHDWEKYCRPAIFRVGCMRGAAMVSGFKDKGDLVELAEWFKNHPNTYAFEKEYVTVTPELLEMHFHYCPLVAAWQRLTDDEKLIDKCCDIAMDGDRGMFTNIPDCEFTIESTIAKGDPVCKLVLKKTK